tara:strand:+ start:104561 stop:106246 length:1686 start_codon:yes stop_codon:yes gene_type:complete
MTEENKTVTVTIDGLDVEVPPGTNMIEAAALLGKEVPHYCYHPKLSVAGNCRMCLVEMGMPMRDRATGEAILDEEGNPKIGWMPKPAIACATEAAPGMRIKTDSELVKNCQEGVMEFLLVNHPLDCPICDQAGECSLQEFATDYGRGASRYIEKKNVKPKRTRLGPRVTLDDERCILCSRCVRFSKEIAKDDVLGFIDRGSYSTLTCYPGESLDNNYSLNTVDICPVGALTSTDFRFKMRTWFLKRTPSICTESSTGTNTEVWSREGVIYRITPRRNDAVNDTWMTDSGRELYKLVDSEKRLKAPAINGGPAVLKEALERAAEFIQGGSIAYVGSGRASVEEQYLLKAMVKQAPGDAHLIGRFGPGDGLLLAADRNPNVRGALLTGLIDKVPEAHLKALSKKIDSGAVKTLLVHNEDLLAVGITTAQLKKLNIVYLGTHENATSAAAKVTIPTLTVFEKSGSFVNQQFRLQGFAQAVPGPAGVMPDMLVLSRLLALVSKQECALDNAEAIWASMNKELPAFKGVTFKDSNISDGGLLLDGSTFKSFNFFDSQTLHYDPQTS